MKDWLQGQRLYTNNTMQKTCTFQKDSKHISRFFPQERTIDFCNSIEIFWKGLKYICKIVFNNQKIIWSKKSVKFKSKASPLNIDWYLLLSNVYTDLLIISFLSIHWNTIQYRRNFTTTIRLIFMKFCT